jgi:hypothetical protein
LKPNAKPKLQLRKKKVDDDPFASDDEEEEEPKAKISKPLPKVTSKPLSKASGEPLSKAGGSAKEPPPKPGMKKRIRDESESDEDVKPKRRKPLTSKE